MAVHKAIRSNSLAQPQRHRPDHQLKAEIFETLRHLNRGYGVALAALDNWKPKPACKANAAHASLPPDFCMAIETARRSFARKPTGTCSA
jgi:hypothetical protein